MNSAFFRIVVLLILNYSVLGAIPDDQTDSIQVQNRLRTLENDIREVRRDQLNYQIERDLLKDTFSSNYQTVNIILAIVLGLFTVIGFLGIRDIGTIRKDFLIELDKLGDLRKDFEGRMNLFETERKQTKEDHLAI